MRSRSTKYVLGAFSLLLLMLLIGSATAETIIGNAAGESHERIVTLPNSVLIEKFVHHDLADGAKIKDSASGPLSATNTDPTNGIIVVDLDAYNLDVSGKVSGTGTACLDAHVVAEGFIDPDTGMVVVNTDIASSVDLESGDKGKAEGRASASGEGSVGLVSTLDVTAPAVLTANVSGSTSASGKVSSGSASDLFAIGVIDSDAFVDFVNGVGDADAEIFSDVEGLNKAEGSASADGSADASIVVSDPELQTAWVLDASADAATSASGKGSGSGEFEVEAEAESHTDFVMDEILGPSYSVYSEVEAEAWSEGDKTYSASTFASASTGMAENGASVTFIEILGDEVIIIPLADVSTAGTATASTSQKGAGEVDAESEIEAKYETPGEFDWEELLVLDDIAGIGFSEVPALEAGYSAVWSDVWVEGSGSAVATADGEAEQFGQPFLGVIDGTTQQTVMTEAEGETGASAKSTGTGTAEAWATIDSDGLVASNGGEFVFFFDVGLPEASIDVPELPGLPEAPELNELLANDQLFGNERVMPTDSVGLLQNSEEFRGMLDALRGDIPTEIALPEELSGEGAIDLPPIMTTSLSIIESGASASGNGKKDSASASSFVKDGMTEGSAQLRSPQFGVSKSFTSSEGSTATSASANQFTDPASEAAITSISVQGIGMTSGLDASLIGSISVAEGAKGTSSGMADGETTADGAFVVLVDNAEVSLSGPTSADGVVHTTATANNGVSAAVAGLGSADYEITPITPIGVFVGEIIDISVLGSTAGIVGTGSAAADAAGTTEASGQIVGLAPTVFVNSLSNATGSSSVKVSAQNGIAAAVDGLAAGEFVNVVSVDTDTSSIVTSNLIGGSLIGELVFAERFDGKGFAKAEAAASGTARTNGSFNVTDGIDPLTGETRFFAGGALTEAQGSVAGKADVICADPLSTSMILAFTSVEGSDILGIEGPEMIGGDVYGAGLVASASVADGTCAKTSGSADGAATVEAGLFVNKAVEVAGEESQDQSFGSEIFVDGAVATNAEAKGGLAASVAAEGASASIEYVNILGTAFVLEQSDIALMLTGSTAFGTSSSSASASSEELEAASGLEITDYDLDDETGEVVSHIEAVADAEAEVMDDAAASSSAKATQGFALGVSGIGSGVFTEFASFAEVDELPAADITSVSLLISGVAGASDSTKGIAKADATASGETEGETILFDELGFAAQDTNAQGTTSATAETKAKSDPISVAAILSFSDLETGIDPDTQLYEQDLNEGTLIASGSFTAGDRSSTSGSADGSAKADGEWMMRITEEDEDPFLILDSDSTTAADVASSATSTKGGVGLSAAGVGSMSETFSSGEIAFVEDDNLEFAFAGAEGDNKMSTATAASGYEDAESTASGRIFLMDLENPQLFSTSDVSGDGMANVKVNGENMAKGLAFGVSAGDTMNNGVAVFSVSEVAFGTQAMASDNAPVEAHVAMEDTGVHAFSATNTDLDPTFATLGYEDGVSYIDLLPKKNTLVWDTYAIGDPNPEVNIGGAAATGDDKAYSLIADPNFAVWTKAGIAVSEPPLPPAPNFFILDHLPPF